METLWQDLRYGWRMLVRYPGFTLVAVFTLALGIGANTAIFSVVNAVLLRPLPYPEPERIVTFRSNQSLPDLTDVETQTRTLVPLGGVVVQGLDYTSSEEPIQVEAGMVTGYFFEVLGARAARGRLIAPEENRFGGPPLAVLSDALWQDRFGADPAVIGREIALSGRSYTVIGVLEAGFKPPREEPDLYLALPVANPVAAGVRGVHFLRTYARLAAGASIAQAQTEMEAIDRRLTEIDPVENKTRRTILIPLHERVVGETRPALLVLLAAVGLVLLVASANYANLLLARGAAREQEIVIRAALGAGRWRIIRQMLIESVLLAVIGGAAGLLVAIWGIDLLVALKPESLPRLDQVAIDLRVLGFALAVAVSTGLLFGLAPALTSSRADVNEALKGGGRSATAGASRRRTRAALVVIEIALSLVLLVGAGLLIRSFQGLRQVAPGFDPAGVLSMRLELPEARYREIPPQTRYREQVLSEINTLPGARAAMISEAPLGGSWLTHNLAIEGRESVAPGEEPEILTRSIMGDYFGVMRIPLLRGRDFTTADRAGAPMVGIVNEAFARSLFPNEDPIGRRVRWARGAPQWIEIIGIVGDVRHFGLARREEPAVYTPYAQSPMPWKRWMQVLVRTEGAPMAMAGAVKERIWAVDPLIPVTKMRTMTELAAESIATQRFYMLLLGIFSALALLLAAIGVYGVISYSVAQRSRELGIRLALGAASRDLLHLVIGEGLRLAAAGVALGLLGAFALTRLMTGLLYGIAPSDPLTFVTVAALLLAVALLACWAPARRAARTDPIVALRDE